MFPLFALTAGRLSRLETDGQARQLPLKRRRR